jgi:glycosyltransferase involved in cell wall biosynthesis
MVNIYYKVVNEKVMRNCIFHIPYKISKNGTGARMVRPRKMIQAFRDIGYDVFVIEGCSEERQIQIRSLEQQIRSGWKFEFMYSESSTMPTILTDPDHLPRHPFMDFSFFKYIQSCGIPIGLFYADIYWKFADYGARLPWWKRSAALLCYQYDLREYDKYLSKFYGPNIRILQYLENDKLSAIYSNLLPGADNLKCPMKCYANRNFEKEPLQILYVGGLGNQYQIAELVKAVASLQECELVLCCRKTEWEKTEPALKANMSSRIHVVHKSGDELEPLYKKADICSLMFEKSEYRNMAIPFKTFEYLAHEKPILATEETAGGELVRRLGIGWSITNSEEAIRTAIEGILSSPSQLTEKQMASRLAKKENLWTTRARQVARDLA